MDVASLESHRRCVTTSSGAISYLDVGRGRTAVFVHGVITNGLLWRRVICAVASEQRRCIAIDLPGHGHTPPAPDNADVSLTGLAQRVIELCDHLGLDEVDLVGNDTGGAVAQIVAARLGNRLATLTLTNCDTEQNLPPRLFKPVVLAARWPRTFELLGPWSATHPKVVRSMFMTGYQQVRQVPREVLNAYWRPVLGTPGAARAFARLLTSLDSADLAAVRPQLYRLKAPTLIAWGTGDIFFNLRWAHRLADLIPGARIVTIPGARLFFPDERAGDFAPLLQQHWQ